MGLFQLALLGALASLGLTQDCPIFGPAYPEVTKPGPAAAFGAARTAIEDEIARGLAGGQLDKRTVFAIQVFSRHSDQTLYEQYHGPSIGPETLYRIASTSKLLTVYTTLAELGDRHWNDPVTKYVLELAGLKVQNPVYDVDWSEVTLGALGSHMGGILRDYAVGDLAPYLQQAPPGLPTLNETEQIQCGATEAFAKISRSFPIAPSYHTPAYSNVAFQLLSYAVEAITGTKFAALVDKNLLQPLNLARTFLTKPNDTDAFVASGWDWDFGDEAPAAGYYSSPNDLTKLGRSILRSALLPRATTRHWLKPVTHTTRAAFSLGRPWEIFRLAVPVSTSPSLSSTTRVVDTYTKRGNIGGYQTLLALSPDHGTYSSLKEKLDGVWLAAAEQAGREEVGVYGGNPADLFIFELGQDGKAVAVEVPLLRKTFRRDGNT
ncbi:beta-lactamase/transpeptidase-like protein [Parachaetomium inaequale]|uniref:Beta-lactamase/transpeptidase-like protein n=1 Tax=Parachaetomium inaequale TaxID=2588326 RepID=A0AAN6PLZ8_9PEZI|nr:beta-lactamase/transpeptidase-like protein [Parachaetomium inaequale]